MTPFPQSNDYGVGIPDPIEPGGKRSGRKGCLFWALVMAGIGTIVLVVTSYLTMRAIEDRMMTFSDETPMTMPTPHRSAERRLALVERMEAFLDNIEAGNPDRIELTGDDIDILLSHYTPAEEKGWRLHTSIHGAIVRVKASVPIGSLVDVTPFPLKEVGQRYLNGTFDFQVSLQDGVLEVYLTDLHVSGQALDDDLRAELRGKNLAEDVEQSHVGRWVRNLDTLEVRDGKVILAR